MESRDSTKQGALWGNDAGVQSKRKHKYTTFSVQFAIYLTQNE